MSCWVCLNHVARAQRWCRARVPEHVHDEVLIEADVSDRRHDRGVPPLWPAGSDRAWTRFPLSRRVLVLTGPPYVKAAVGSGSWDVASSWCRSDLSLGGS